MNAEATWNREYRNQYMAGVEYAELLENGDLRSDTSRAKKARGNAAG